MFPPDGSVVRVNQYDSAVLQCLAVGIPRPTISWFVLRDNQNVSLSTQDTVIIADPVLMDNYPLSSGRGLVLAVNSTLVVNETVDQDSGMYYCVASSLPGNDSQGIELEIQGIFLMKVYVKQIFRNCNTFSVCHHTKYLYFFLQLLLMSLSILHLN